MRLLNNIVLAVFLIFVTSCSTDVRPPKPKVPNPYFAPGALTFTDKVEVEIVCLMVRAKVFYTLDGSVPDRYSKHFIDPIVLKETTTIRAIAYRHDFKPSDVVEATFTLNKAGIIFTPDAGLYRRAENITITSIPAGAQIYFTLNGKEPYQHEALRYTEPISLPIQNFDEMPEPLQ